MNKVICFFKGYHDWRVRKLEYGIAITCCSKCSKAYKGYR